MYPLAEAHLHCPEQRLPGSSKARNEPWAWALLGGSQGLGTGSQISPISGESQFCGVGLTIETSSIMDSFSNCQESNHIIWAVPLGLFPRKCELW